MSERLYYSINEVSEMLSVPLPTLRFWEKEVAQLHPKIQNGRTRCYTKDDIDLLRRIIYLRQQNVPVKDLSARLRLDSRVTDKRMAARDNLLALRADLIALRDMI